MTKKPMSDSKAVEVSFDFWSSGVDVDLIGTVIDRGHEMVIDIPRQKAQGPYLILGRRKGRLFSGSNSSSKPEAPEVEAEWCEFTDQFAGVWIENGDEMLFSFRLPRR
jgi:hypothetical protein